MHIHAYLGDNGGFVPNHLNEVNMAIKRVTRTFLISQYI